MYSLRLTCSPDEVDLISGELWEAGTAGIREETCGAKTLLIAGFETNRQRTTLLARFAQREPEWLQEDAIDWVAETERAWPAREVGGRLFLAPPWCQDPTPVGRERVIHNPGLACGTGEHPCTQLALMALERCVSAECRLLVDVGTGSGLLAIAALRLGARLTVGIDSDEAALHSAQENFALNGLAAELVSGTADCLRDGCADVTVANISGTVLLALADDLLRVTGPRGWLILTGFTDGELPAIKANFPEGEVTQADEWRCLTARLS